jgi:hypothetical protein
MQSTNPTSLPPYTGTLTPAHLAVVRAERDRWLRIGLSTTPADRPAAEAAVRRAYQTAGLLPPSLVVWMDSPLGGCLATAIIGQLRAQFGGQFQGHIRDRLWGQLGDQLWDRLGFHLGRQLRDQLGDQLRDQLGRQLRDQLQGQLDDQLRGRLGYQLQGQLWGRLQSQLDGQLQGQLWGRLQSRLQSQLRDWLGGQLQSPLEGQLRAWLHDQFQGQLSWQLDPWHASYWLAASTCELRIAGLPPSPQLDALADAVAHLGRWSPLRGAVVLTDRPTVLARDQQGRLHAETGPAWPDRVGTGHVQ